MTANRSSRKELRSWESRREMAEQMFAAGEKQSDVARAVGVSRQVVHNWFWHWQVPDTGKRRDQKRRGGGRRTKLDKDQWSDVDTALRRGPRSFGFTGERWTLWRVATVIEKLTGTSYHPSSVWRLLRSMGWTLRLPPKSKWKPRTYVPRQWAAPARRSPRKARPKAKR